MLHGHVALTPGALGLLLGAGVSVSFLTAHGRYRGALTGPLGKDVFLRIAQVDRSRDPRFCLRVANALLGAKIEGSIRTLRRFAANHPDGEMLAAAHDLDRDLRRLRDAPDVSSVMGQEGAAASRYFSVFGRMLRNGMGFPGRRRRPPPDPVNALLGFLYVLATSEASGAVEGAGLDPAIGLLHGLRYGRPSLALDLVEPFRPEIDQIAVAAFNLAALKSEHFVETAAGVKMTEVGRRAALELYENAASDDRPRARRLRHRIRMGAEQLRRWIKRGTVSEEFARDVADPRDHL